MADTSRHIIGRQKELKHWLELAKKFFGGVADMMQKHDLDEYKAMVAEFATAEEHLKDISVVEAGVSVFDKFLAILGAFAALERVEFDASRIMFVLGDEKYTKPLLVGISETGAKNLYREHRAAESALEQYKRNTLQEEELARKLVETHATSAAEINRAIITCACTSRMVVFIVKELIVRENTAAANELLGHMEGFK